MMKLKNNERLPGLALTDIQADTDSGEENFQRCT